MGKEGTILLQKKCYEEGTVWPKFAFRTARRWKTRYGALSVKFYKKTSLRKLSGTLSI